MIFTILYSEVIYSIVCAKHLKLFLRYINVIKLFKKLFILPGH